jgi:hypothetical protein
MTALDEPGVRSRVERERLGAVVTLCAGIVAMLAVLIAVPRLDRMYSDHQLQMDRFRGEITYVFDEGSGDDDNGSAQVEFTERGTRRTADVFVEDTHDWFDGEPVTVFVDPHDRSFVTLRGENYLPEWFRLWWFVAGGGAFAAILGATTLHRVHVVRRALSKGSWRSVAGRRVSVGSGNSTLHLMFLPSVSRGSFWRLLRRPGKGSEFRVEIAGADDTRLVVRPCGSRRLLLAKRAATDGPATGCLSAFAPRDSKVGLRIDSAEGHQVVEIKDADLAARLGEDGFDGPREVTLWHGPSGAVAALFPGDELPVVGAVCPVRKARRQWPDLAPR